ncbi:MAG: energy coupling factor transporter S component ThiW [Desulfobacterales bacterium]
MARHTEALHHPMSISRKTAYAVVLVAIGVALAPYTSFPIGIAKINPTQHFINVLSAVILGPWWALLNATVVAVIRNALGVGTLLAFPGGMIGAVLAGVLYAWTRKVPMAAAGEIAGTGFVAPVVSAAVVAPVFMGKAIPMLALLPSFLASTVAGSLLAVMFIRLLVRTEMIDLGD